MLKPAAATFNYIRGTIPFWFLNPAKCRFQEACSWPAFFSSLASQLISEILFCATVVNNP
jgi:hypothetical protein